MPGAEKLLSDLSRARNASGERVRKALATKCKSEIHTLKISRPETKAFLDCSSLSYRRARVGKSDLMLQ